MNEKNIKKVLDYFPSNINVYDTVLKKSKTFIQTVVDKRLREEEADTFNNDLEKLKGYNLLSFLYFVLDDRERALRYNDLALEVDDRNINALACGAFYHLKRSEFYDSGQICQKLKALKEDSLEKVKAKSEVAYLFSKFGMTFYPEAEKRFEEVLDESKECDTPKLYRCSWLFSLAQTIRRQLNLHNAPTPIGPDQAKTLYQRVIDLFTEITQKSGGEVDRYRARAFAELGLVLFYNKNLELHSTYTHEDCMTTALELRPNDDFVQEKCGKYFRLTKNIQYAITCFKSAIEIKESSYSYHHLALCYKNIINNEQRDANRNNRRQSSYRNNPSSATSARNPFASQRNIDGGHMAGRGAIGIQSNDIGRVGQETPRGNRNLQSGRGRVPQNGNNNSMGSSVRGNIHVPLSQEQILQLNVLKCPRKLPYIPPAKITVVLEYFNKALSLSDNTGALYDKGLIYRQSKQLDKAIEMFKFVIENGSSSDVQKTNSYEQAALCMIEKAEDEPWAKVRYEVDAKAWLKKAMEISCNIIRRVPNLHLHWHSRPTLKKLLLREVRTKQNLRELADFYKLVENYPVAIGFFEQVLQMEDDEEEKQEVLVELVNANLKIKNYDDALLALHMILCLPDGDEIAEIELILHACIKGGIDAWRCCEREVARKRIKTALHYSSANVTGCREPDDSDHDNEFDVFILSSPSSEESARHLCNTLLDFGLKTTLNSDDVLPGRLPRGEIMRQIEKSHHVMVYLGSEDEETDLDYLETYIETIKKFTVISESSRAERNSLFGRYPVIKFDCGIREENGNIKDDFIQWVEDFLFKITSQ